MEPSIQNCANCNKEVVCLFAVRVCVCVYVYSGSELKCLNNRTCAHRKYMCTFLFCFVYICVFWSVHCILLYTCFCCSSFCYVLVALFIISMPYLELKKKYAYKLISDDPLCGNYYIHRI